MKTREQEVLDELEKAFTHWVGTHVDAIGKPSHEERLRWLWVFAAGAEWVTTRTIQNIGRIKARQFEP